MLFIGRIIFLKIYTMRKISNLAIQYLSVIHTSSGKQIKTFYNREYNRIPKLINLQTNRGNKCHNTRSATRTMIFFIYQFVYYDYINLHISNVFPRKTPILQKPLLLCTFGNAFNIINKKKTVRYLFLQVRLMVDLSS